LSLGFTLSFAIWIVVGGLFGWLVRRRGQRPMADVAIGIVAAVTGGLLWSPFFEMQPFFKMQHGGNYFDTPYAFDFLFFNLFCAVFGSAPIFWLVDSLRRRAEDLSRSSARNRSASLRC
jgi:uncharacterized membrane protein YeaQ/YmgE (transglycosylase-associated protein family)